MRVWDIRKIVSSRVCFYAILENFTLFTFIRCWALGISGYVYNQLSMKFKSNVWNTIII